MARAAARASGAPCNVVAPTSLAGQFEQPYGPDGAADFVHDPGLALHEDLWLTHEQLAMVSVVLREWAAKNPAPPSRRRSPPRMC
jgi:hypothetical protein